MLALSNCLEMVDTLSSSDARQDRALFVLPVLWNDDCDGLANSLVGSVAKDTFRTSIPARDNAIEIFAYNCVVTVLDDRCKPTQSLFAFAKRGFNSLALIIESFDLRNVAIDLKHGVITEQLHPAVYRDFAAILADMAQLARPVTLIQQEGSQLRKFDWEFGL